MGSLNQILILLIVMYFIIRNLALQACQIEPKCLYPGISLYIIVIIAVVVAVVVVVLMLTE